MRDLVMGFGNLAFPLVEPFLASLRDIGFAGDICLFVHDIDVETIEALCSHGVIVEYGRTFLRPARHILCSRFFMYLDFLARHHRRYGRVMLTDIRDVIFQSDPFAHLGDADIVYAHERARIRECQYNAGWVRQAYGEGIYANIAEYYVSCAGTTIGTIDGILGYLAAMTDEMSASRVPDQNIDQGIHNFVVHMRPLPGAWLDTSDTGVATLHHMPLERLAVTAPPASRSTAAWCLSSTNGTGTLKWPNVSARPRDSGWPRPRHRGATIGFARPS